MKLLLVLLLGLMSVMAGAYAFQKQSDLIEILLGSKSTYQNEKYSGVLDYMADDDLGFDIEKLVISGNVTIIELYASWCSACKALKKDYQLLLNVRPDVHIKRIKMKDNWNKDWAKKQFGLNVAATPHVLIFNNDGSLLLQDEGRSKKAYKLLYQWMRLELGYKD